MCASMADEQELPRDAKLIKTILRSMGVQQYEPRVVNQFLDFWYRYVVDVLGDAQVYSEHAGKTVVDSDDVKLAIQSRVNVSFSQPPPREVLMELAKMRNSIPLPKIIGGSGVGLPPDQDMLVAPNYQLDVPLRTFQFSEDADLDDENEMKEKDLVASQPTTLHKATDQDAARKVSFSVAGKRPKS